MKKRLAELIAKSPFLSALMLWFILRLRPEMIEQLQSLGRCRDGLKIATRRRQVKPRAAFPLTSYTAAKIRKRRKKRR